MTRLTRNDFVASLENKRIDVSEGQGELPDPEGEVIGAGDEDSLEGGQDEHLEPELGGTTFGDRESEEAGPDDDEINVHTQLLGRVCRRAV